MKKIAIIRRNGLGDLLCSVPMIRYLQCVEPESEITLFVDQRNAPVIPYLPKMGKMVVLPAKGNKYLQLLKLGSRYRQEHFDVAISAKTSPMKLMNLLLFALGAKERIAVVDNAWHRRLINVPRVYNERQALTEHQALKGLRLVWPEAQEVPQMLYPKITLSSSLSCALPRPYLLLSATTTREVNRFNPKRYAHIVNRLERDFSVIILSQPEDTARAEAIASHLKLPKKIVVPDSFDTFMLWLNLCDLYFIGDGGIGHLGAALGKKGVVAYGDAHACTQWRPLSSTMVPLSHPETVNKISEEVLVEALRGCDGRRDDL